MRSRYQNRQSWRLLAKQCVREAKLALDEKRERVAELRNDQQRLTLESQRLGAVMARLDDDVQLAMRGSDETLARAAIRKLLPLREADRRLAARLVTLRDEEKRIVERLAVQEQEFEILRARLQAELAAGGVEGGADTFESPVVTDDDVELELLRRKEHDAREATKGVELRWEREVSFCLLRSRDPRVQDHFADVSLLRGLHGSPPAS